MCAKVAIAGAGIYGATAAIRLAEAGHAVTLFDPLGILQAASAINQYRVHSGYHYPRSPETIRETLEERNEFVSMYAPAIVRNSRHYYAIPREGSRTPPAEYEDIMRSHGLKLNPVAPDWMNFDFIQRCYEVNENIYDPDLLRSLIESRFADLNMTFEQRELDHGTANRFDFVVWATYAMGPSAKIFNIAKYQVAEKILISLPSALHGVALVVVDGPFTAFDPYGNSTNSLFGSAKHTNHWTTTDPQQKMPEPYAKILNKSEFVKVPFSRFEAMRADAALTAPLAAQANYLGSRFTIRVVEDDPRSDRRTLYVRNGTPQEFHVFSGKVVGAVKAARILAEKIANNA
jgi:hypothetical protein